MPITHSDEFNSSLELFSWMMVSLAPGPTPTQEKEETSLKLRESADVIKLISYSLLGNNNHHIDPICSLRRESSNFGQVISNLLSSPYVTHACTLWSACTRWAERYIYPGKEGKRVGMMRFRSDFLR